MVTQPDRPAGRGRKTEPTPVKREAERLGVPVHAPAKLVPFAEEARALAPDAFVVASYGRIVPRALLEAVPIAFNVHPSLLPLYRGATPLQSVLRDGRGETGVTIIAMDAGMDTGDVLLQERLPIGARETYGELHDRTASIGARLAVDAIGAYEHGTLRREPQPDAARRLGVGEREIAATATRPWTKDDWALREDRTAAEMDGLVRALAPRPGARVLVPPLGTVRILAAHVDPVGPSGIAAAPGTLACDARGVWIRAADGWLAVERIVPPGRNAMPARDFVSGYARQLGAAGASAGAS